MVFALFVLLLFLLFQRQEKTVKRVGSWIASAYKDSCAKGRNKAMVWLSNAEVTLTASKNDVDY